MTSKEKQDKFSPAVQSIGSIIGDLAVLISDLDVDLNGELGAERLLSYLGRIKYDLDQAKDILIEIVLRKD